MVNRVASNTFLGRSNVPFELYDIQIIVINSLLVSNAQNCSEYSIITKIISIFLRPPKSGDIITAYAAVL